MCERERVAPVSSRIAPASEATSLTHVCVSYEEENTCVSCCVSSRIAPVSEASSLTHI